jgi:trigger factor
MAQAAHVHDDKEKKFSPKHEVQEIGPCKLKVLVEISAERVQEEVDHKYKEINDSMALPGFRKGHAPRLVLERKFGKALLDDVKAEILSGSFEEVREERKLEPVGEPDIDVDKLKVEAGKPFAYEVTIEVRPNIDIKEYEGIKVARPAVIVKEKSVDKVLKGFQESKAELIPVENGLALADDQIIADLTLVLDGKTLDSCDNSALFLAPDLSFYGVELKEYYLALVGKKVGDMVEYPVKLPQSFMDKAHAGEDAVIRTAIKAIKRKQVPEINDDFAKKHFDMDSVDEIRKDIRKRLVREEENRGRAVMGEQIVEEIIRANDFPMPEGIIASGAEEAQRRAHVDLTMKGMSEEEIRKIMEEEDQTRSRENMAKALKAHFILEHLAQKEKIFVTEDQVEECVNRLATQHGKWPHEMKAYLEENGLLAQLRRRMREELVKDYLLSKAVIEEEKTPGLAES